MNKIRVLHIIQNLNVGGLERIAAQIAAGLDKSRFEAELWCLSGSGPLERTFKDRIPVIRMFDYRRYLLPWNVMSIAGNIRKGDFNVVHTHSYPPGIIGRLSARLAGVKAVFHHHHSVSVPYMNMRRRLCEQFVSNYLTDKVIACSYATKEFILKENFAKENKITVIYNGVPEEFEILSGKKDSVKHALAINDEKLLTAVGSLTKHKGHIYLLQALTKVLEVFPAVKLVIVGEGPERSTLEQYIKENNLSSNVVLAGSQSDVRPFLENTDIFILPSLREAMPLSLLEAMAKGLPAIGSRVDGIKEVIEDYETGITVSPANKDELAEKIIYLLRNTEIAIKIGNKGFEKYKVLFTFQKMIDNIQNLYLEFLGGR